MAYYSLSHIRHIILYDIHAILYYMLSYVIWHIWHICHISLSLSYGILYYMAYMAYYIIWHIILYGIHGMYGMSHVLADISIVSCGLPVSVNLCLLVTGCPCRNDL